MLPHTAAAVRKDGRASCAAVCLATTIRHHVLSNLPECCEGRNVDTAWPQVARATWRSVLWMTAPFAQPRSGGCHGRSTSGMTGTARVPRSGRHAAAHRFPREGGNERQAEGGVPDLASIEPEDRSVETGPRCVEPRAGAEDALHPPRLKRVRWKAMSAGSILTTCVPILPHGTHRHLRDRQRRGRRGQHPRTTRRVAPREFESRKTGIASSWLRQCPP